ncbi:hypothetical protein V8E54_015087 [Elaphomyces granulatus]|jgi:hypothetical protein
MSFNPHYFLLPHVLIELQTLILPITPGVINQLIRYWCRQMNLSVLKLKASQVPFGWTNNPDRLEVHRDRPQAELRTYYNIPKPQFILNSNGGRSNFLLNGDRKYYLWNDIADDVWRIEERSLQKILAALESGGVSNLSCTLLYAQDPSDLEQIAVKEDNRTKKRKRDMR